MKWIRVEDQLPREATTVLVVITERFADGLHRYGGTAGIYYGHWMGDAQGAAKVTHWMPFPELPPSETA